MSASGLNRGLRLVRLHCERIDGHGPRQLPYSGQWRPLYHYLGIDSFVQIYRTSLWRICRLYYSTQLFYLYKFWKLTKFPFHHCIIRICRLTVSWGKMLWKTGKFEWRTLYVEFWMQLSLEHQKFIWKNITWQCMTVEIIYYNLRTPDFQYELNSNLADKFQFSYPINWNRV